MIRRTFYFQFQPVRDLLSAARVGEWMSTGENPAFDIEVTDGAGRVPTGWVYVESRIIRRGAHLVARIEVDTGSGFEEAVCLDLPAARSGNIKHIVEIPSTARRLRLVPLRGEGSVRLDFFRMTKISRAERYIRMLEWVIGDISKFKNTDQARKYDLTWRRLLGGLRSAYEDCANLRFHSTPIEYASYIEKFDTLRETDVESIRQHTKMFGSQPLFSVLVEICNPTVEHLHDAIQSVLDQIYENWQLCIVVSGGVDERLHLHLDSLTRRDRRVKVVFRTGKGPASAASNDALALADGEFVVKLGQHDRLARTALYFAALKINESDRFSVIYSDGDTIDRAGERRDPHFKSGWNPDLFLSVDMLSDMAIYRASLLRDVGGSREAFDAAQDYDIALRCIKKLHASQIAHIARVLYHRRSSSVGTAAHPYSMDDIQASQEMALADFFVEQPGVVISRGNLLGSCRVRYPVPSPMPKVSVIIPTRDGGPLLKKCVDSVLQGTDYDNLEVVIVDNQSAKEETVNYLKSLTVRSHIKVLKYDFPFNYSAINNFAVKHASGDVVCFLNDDVEAIEPDWLKEMVSHSLRPDIGIVGAKLLYGDNFIQHAGVVMGIGGFASHVHRLYPAAHPGYAGRAVLTQNFSAVTGACMVMRRALFDDIGGFDEENLPVAFNDVDLCFRVREAGYRVLWTPYAVLHHYESYSRGDDQMSAEKRARFNREKNFMLARWKTHSVNDPYYNPNLTLDREDFTLANLPTMHEPWRE